MAIQTWIVSHFPDFDQLEVGLGLGPYFNIDTKHPRPGFPKDDPAVAGLLTPSFALRITAHTAFRFSWERVITSYNRDADVWLFGLGYRW